VRWGGLLRAPPAGTDPSLPACPGNTTPRSRPIWRIRGVNCRYVERCDGSLRFCWVKAPTSAELTGLAHTLARRIGRFLEREGLLVQDAENSYLAGEAEDEGPMDQLLGSSITYRIAVGPQQGRKVFTLQSLPASAPQEALADTAGKVAGFSLHAGVAARADERKKLERLCRYIALHGCRVLRRLGTIASAAARRSRKNASRSPRTATSATT
jgi:Putative transposase